MTKPRLVNLLDDFALGGVSRGLGIFDSWPVRTVVEPEVVAIDRKAMLAPALDADVIVTHFPPSWRRLAFLASLRMHNPEARIVHVEHSYTRAWEAAHVTNKLRFRAMLRMAMSMVDQVVCVSHGQAEWLAEAANLAVADIVVIYPYSYNDGLDALPVPTFDAPGGLRIGAYGRFHQAKGFDTLIEAWKAGAIRGSELLIGGFGAEEARLRALAGDAPGIRFVGQIDDVAGFLKQCDVVAIPSRWEAFGQVATEAREAGRPIIVSPVDGLPEQVGKAGLVVDFTDQTALRAAFAALNPARLTAMSYAARSATCGCGLRRQRQWANLLVHLTCWQDTPFARRLHS